MAIDFKTSLRLGELAEMYFEDGQPPSDELRIIAPQVAVMTPEAREKALWQALGNLSEEIGVLMREIQMHEHRAGRRAA